jgi:sugar phosphate isomerase/epimerase
MMFGVSPAFVLSGWGEGFSPADYAEALDLVAKLKFTSFQLEVFSSDQLGEWLSGGSTLVGARADSLGLRPSQLVAHFLLPSFSSSKALQSTQGLEEMKMVVEILEAFPACSVVTLPIGGFRSDRLDPASAGSGKYEELERRFVDKLLRFLEIVEPSGRRMALEILPYSFLGGTSGLLRLLESIASARLGYNFDTGHAWACKEEVALIPLKFGERIFGTHLCDNLGHENLSLRPGAGNVPWETVLSNLLACGYRGSLDLEIRCQAAELEAEYSTGFTYLQSLLKGRIGAQERS